MGFPTGRCYSVEGIGWAEDIGLRQEMEDGFVFVDRFMGKRSGFMAIYDGHGGRQCVEYMMEYLHDNLAYEIRQGAGIPSAFVKAFANTDASLLSSGINQSGCTACCCLILPDGPGNARNIYAAHLGDARAILCRGKQAVRLTSPSDHKATDLEEAERVIKNGGHITNERVNGMLAIARAFGDHQLKRPIQEKDLVSNDPHIKSIALTEQDSFVIVACDGVWDVMHDQEAVNLVLEGYRALSTLPGGREILGYAWAEVLSRIIVEEALLKGTSDNVSCIVAFL